MRLGVNLMTILYADDDPEDLELFADAMTEIDPEIEVFLAPDGPSALERLDALPFVPDLIFFDVNMPILSGMECVAALRKSERFKDATLILYSTTSSELESYKGLKAGASRFLQKPETYLKTIELLKGVVKAPAANK